MPLADPLKALQADSATMLLLDRRRDNLNRVICAGGFARGQTWVLPSPVGGAPVYVAAMHPLRRKLSRPALPRRIVTVRGIYQRLVDRFYLPTAPDPIVSATLFELIASIYDRLISQDINMETARVLLEAGLPSSQSAATRILDFGCGTGLAFSALARLGRPNMPIELIGTDASQNMLVAATQRGETTISINAWRELPDDFFAGAIAAFVMHYGVSASDLRHIARQLRRGAALAVNYFKGNDFSSHALVEQLAHFDLVLERTGSLLTTPGTSNPLLVFVKGGSSR
jgi:ubiquinone/menaquinone biosynthesis C-methylase UbiE